MLFIPAEYILDADAKKARYPERALQRWRIPVLLDRDDGLTCYADGVAELLLGHGPMLFAQAAHPVGDRRLTGHDLQRRPVEDDLQHVLHNLAEHQAGKNGVEQQVAIA